MSRPVGPYTLREKKSLPIAYEEWCEDPPEPRPKSTTHRVAKKKIAVELSSPYVRGGYVVLTNSQQAKKKELCGNYVSEHRRWISLTIFLQLVDQALEASESVSPKFAERIVDELKLECWSQLQKDVGQGKVGLSHASYPMV